MQYQLTLKDFVMNFHSSKRKLILKTFAVGFLGLHAEAASCISALKTDWKFNYNFSCEKDFLQKVNFVVQTLSADRKKWPVLLK